jgi:hypothetical protein
MSTAEHWFEYSFCVGKRVLVCWTNCCAPAGGAIAATAREAARTVWGAVRGMLTPEHSPARAGSPRRIGNFGHQGARGHARYNAELLSAVPRENGKINPG